MIAIVQAYKDKQLTKPLVMPNLVSGLVVGIVALPLAMAFAIASGAKPEQGIYTAIIAGLAVSLFGGTGVQIAGPTGAFIVILSGITAKYGISGLQVATLMAGVMLLFFGLTHLGSIIRFIPDPVIVGFTTGIGLIIFVGQWKDFFGLPSVEGELFHEKFLSLVDVLPELHLATTALGVLTLLVTVLTPKVKALKKVPGPLMAMTVVTLVNLIFHPEGVQTIGTAFGGIPTGLPRIEFPALTFKQVVELTGPAFTIAMLGAIESLLSAVVADGMTGKHHDSNQELVGQGVANILTPLFGGFAATGAIARTATNVRYGGTNPIAGLSHSLFLILVILIVAPLASHIPLAALAGILFVVAWNMSELPHFYQMLKRSTKSDALVLLVTTSLTIFVDLVVAVNIGVILAILQFLRRMAKSVDLHTVDHHDLEEELHLEEIGHLPDDVLVYELEGPMFFAAAGHLQRALADTHTEPHTIILRFKWVPFIDITGLQALEDFIQHFSERKITVLLTGANPTVENQLLRSNIISLLGEENYFRSIREAVQVVMGQPRVSAPLQAMNDTPNQSSKDIFHTLKDSFNKTALRRAEKPHDH